MRELQKMSIREERERKEGVGKILGCCLGNALEMPWT